MIKYENLTKEQQMAVQTAPPIDIEQSECPFATLNNKACEHCRFCVDRLGEAKASRERSKNFSIEKERYTCIFVVQAFKDIE